MTMFKKQITKNVLFIIKCVLIVCIFFGIVLTCSYMLTPIVMLTDESITNYLEMMSHNDIDIAFVGTSRTVYGIESLELSELLNKQCINVAASAQSYQESYFLTKELYKNNNPEIVFLEVSIARLYREEGNRGFIDAMEYSQNKVDMLKAFNDNGSSYYIPNAAEGLFNFLQYKKEPNIVKQIYTNLKWKFDKSYREFIETNNKFDIEYVQKQYDIVRTNKLDTYQYFHGRGHWTRDLRMEKNRAGAGTVSIATSGYRKNGIFWTTDDEANEERVSDIQLEYLKKTIEYCRSKGARVILHSPVVAYAFIANMQEEYDNYIAYMQRIADEYNIEFYEFGLLKKERMYREDDYFWDLHHLSDIGAEAYTSAFYDFYKNIIRKNNRPISYYLYESVAELKQKCPFVYYTRLVREDSTNNIIKASTVKGTNAKLEYEFQWLNNGNWETFYKGENDTVDIGILGKTQTNPRNIEIKVIVNSTNTGNEAMQWDSRSFRRV